jgi:hypothetical protein
VRKEQATVKTLNVTLPEADRAKLAQANRLLTELTEAHSHACGCALCEARWQTDVQHAPECWTIPGVVPGEEAADASGVGVGGEALPVAGGEEGRGELPEYFRQRQGRRAARALGGQHLSRVEVPKDPVPPRRRLRQQEPRVAQGSDPSGGRSTPPARPTTNRGTATTAASSPSDRTNATTCSRLSPTASRGR